MSYRRSICQEWRIAQLSIPILFAWASGCIASTMAPAPDAAAAPVAERPYVVAAPIGLVVTAPTPTIDDPATSIAGTEAAAAAKRDLAGKGVSLTLFSLAIVPLALINPLVIVVVPAEAAKGVSLAASANEWAAQLEKDAAKLRRAAACMDRLAAAIPSLPQSISSALAIDALRPELQERIEIALQKRTRESPIVLAPVRGENAPAEPALAEASQRALRHLLEVEVNEVRIAVESVGDQPSGCRMRILTSADIRLWDVSARSTIFSQHAVGPGAELTVSMDELPVILDQPRALRARVINQYEDIIVGVLDSPRLKFSAAP